MIEMREGQDGGLEVSTILMKLKIIMLSEVRQVQKDKGYMFSLMW
jgi:hypothetical protein